MSELKTCFKKVDYDLSGLLHYIDIGDIGLPDIQRPFVWSNAKVRDLFDSMYRGFPVGYLLFWENATGTGAKHIGLSGKQRAVPSRLIVDGQQRLTSLFAVFRGKKVLDEDYRERQIEVAFRPRDGKFEVADAPIRRDPEWIANISDIWSSGKPSYSMVKAFLKQLATKGPLTDEEEERISHNLDRLFDLQKYPFTALEIASAVDEEQVADIFVRINSEGVRLNQADFILTLMSVFWDEGRRALETFCRESRQLPSPGGGASPFNHFIRPDPDQLLRVAIAVGFERGRLKSVYQVLRGKDLETGVFSVERRDAQFATLQQAQTEVLNLTHWHQFLSCLIGAGFRSGDQISSQNALLYSYAFYLIGRIRYRVPEHQLQRLIGRWFFAVSLTGRYTTSPESIMDADLNRLKPVKDSDGFAAALEAIMASELTNDYWTVTLPANLDSSSARNPELFAYTAAQNRLGAPVLFSHKKIADLLDPALRTRKKPLERHHLFPRAWLESQGVDDLKQINQVANFALLEWPDNIEISDTPPSNYVSWIRQRFSPEEWAQMHQHHALPANWEQLPYELFLQQRRPLIAAIIRKGFETLKAPGATQRGQVDEIGETAAVEDTPSWQAAKLAATVVERAAQAGLERPLGKTRDKPRHHLRVEFWRQALDQLKAANVALYRNVGPSRDHWLSAGSGLSAVHYSMLFLKDAAGVQFVMDRRKEKNKAMFEYLFARRAEIEAAYGGPLSWDRGDEKKMSKVSAEQPFDGYNRENWPTMIAWLTDRVPKIEAAFARHIPALRNLLETQFPASSSEETAVDKSMA